ncbi:MAG: hypothetical protein FWH19_03135 [Treponema sp.]|nr:hypothetical protein [Treponema sp.]
MKGKRAIKRIPKFLMMAAAIAISGFVLLACINPTEAIPDPFERVRAGNTTELMFYLQSVDSLYDISLDFGPDIYLQENLTISRDMIIRGPQTTRYTIHTVDDLGGAMYSSVVLNANLYMIDCDLALYNAPSASSTPLSFGADKTLTMSNSSLIARPSSPYTANAANGTVLLMEGGSFVNETTNADQIFGAGAKTLVVNKGATAIMQTGGTNIGAGTPAFEIVNGSFAFERDRFIVDGESRLLRNWTLEDGQSLHVKSGELLVPNAVLLTVAEEFAEAILDGNVRLGPGSILHINNNPFPNLKGSGGIVIESGSGALPVVTMIPDPVNQPGIEAELGLMPQTDGRLEISAAGWRLSRINGNEHSALFHLKDHPHVVSDGLNMIVEAGVMLHVTDNLLVNRGGTLDVRGLVYVNADGAIIIANDDDFEGFGAPKGNLKIQGSGEINVGANEHGGGGSFWDSTASIPTGATRFFFPAYGSGKLTVEEGGTAMISRRAQITPTQFPTVVVGPAGPGVQIVLDPLVPGAKFETYGLDNVNPLHSYNYLLTGKATLSAPLTLEGIFNLANDAELTITGGAFSVSGTNRLRGPMVLDNPDPITAKIITTSGGSASVSGNPPLGIDGTYIWTWDSVGEVWSWEEDL